MDHQKTVSVIEPSASRAAPEPVKREKRRVAAYARVSTEKDEQQGSFEAQIDYFTRLIGQNENWEFVKVYADEGLSGTSTRLRKSFREMIGDALAGRIDLIVTKSISRFARNTVDSLTTIRALKEAGCECYFEKENIYTFDPKGELLITILSSLAQEESRSLSENVTWGARKRFADGKYTIHYSEFIGYRQGENGAPEIDEKEASVVRRIFYMCIAGLGPFSIAQILTRDGIMTPMGKDLWSYSVVRSILHNEKYYGDALLQKTYSTSFLTKKRQKNNGEVKQYYVRNGHPAIVSKELFEEAQSALENYVTPRRRKNDKPFSKMFRCGYCGSWYHETVWHPGTKNEKRVWECGNKRKNGACNAPRFSEEELGELLERAERTLCEDKALFLKLLPFLRTKERTLEMMLLEKAEIERFPPENGASPRLFELSRQIEERVALNKTVDGILEGASQALSPRESGLSSRLVDSLAVFTKEKITVRYIDGSEGEPGLPEPTR